MKLVFTIAAVLIGTTAAMAEDYPACAKFQEPMEYNACLARLGPRAGAVQAATPSHASTEAALRGPAIFRSVRSHSAYTLQTRRRGRVRMEFTVRPRR